MKPLLQILGLVQLRTNPLHLIGNMRPELLLHRIHSAHQHLRALRALQIRRLAALQVPANIGVGLEWHAGTLRHRLEGAEERASGFGGTLGDGRDDGRVENVAAVDGGGGEGLWGADDGLVVVEAHGDFAPGEVLLVAKDRDEFVFFHGVFGDARGGVVLEVGRVGCGDVALKVSRQRKLFTRGESLKSVCSVIAEVR